MEFAKYYNVTNKLKETLERKEKILFSYTRGYCEGLFVCEDTNDIWIARVFKGYNSEFEEDENKWLVERNKIDKYDFCELLKKKQNYNLKINDRWIRDNYISKCFDLNTIIEDIILMDDENGLESWDNCECDSYNEAIKVIDGGFGIIELSA